jgi:hypothetical protein
MSRIVTRGGALAVDFAIYAGTIPFSLRLIRRGLKCRRMRRLNISTIGLLPRRRAVHHRLSGLNAWLRRAWPNILLRLTGPRAPFLRVEPNLLLWLTWLNALLHRIRPNVLLCLTWLNALSITIYVAEKIFVFHLLYLRV